MAQAAALAYTTTMTLVEKEEQQRPHLVGLRPLSSHQNVANIEVETALQGEGGISLTELEQVASHVPKSAPASEEKGMGKRGTHFTT